MAATQGGVLQGLRNRRARASVRSERQAGFGQLHDEAGDRQKAVEYYAKLVELWRDADPELQPRVEAAQRRIDEIFAETG